MEKELMSVENLLDMCERSIDENSLVSSFEITTSKYVSTECEEKYLVEGYEYLSKLVQNIIKSGRGYFIVKYAHENNVNVCVTGINDKELLIDYGKWCFKEGKEFLLKIQEEILRLLEEENKMSLVEIRLKNIEYLKTKKKILENICDMEKKAPYCEKLKTLKTVEQSLKSFLELSLLIETLGEELKNLGLVE